MRTEIFFLRRIGKIADDDDFCVAVFKKEFRPPREEKEGEKEDEEDEEHPEEEEDVFIAREAI